MQRNAVQYGDNGIHGIHVKHGEQVWKARDNLRDLSWRDRCSLRLNARLQNWHLYFLSGAVTDEVFRGVDEAEAEADAGGTAATLASGILSLWCDCISLAVFLC